MEIVLDAELVLQRDDRADQWRRFGLDRLADELERVAQPLAGDPELMESRKVGTREAVVKGPHVSIGGPGRRRHPVADEAGGVRSHGDGGQALRLGECPVLAEEAGEGLGLEDLDELDPAGFASASQARRRGDRPTRPRSLRRTP